MHLQRLRFSYNNLFFFLGGIISIDVGLVSVVIKFDISVLGDESRMILLI